jgi:hypothetical protein
VLLTATIIQIRDFQNKRDMERMYSDFANQVATEISNVAIIPHDRVIDTAPSEYCAPDQDSA